MFKAQEGLIYFFAGPSSIFTFINLQLTIIIMTANKSAAFVNLLEPLITAFYSIWGILFFEWDVFYIVYLFWFENFIKIFAFRLKAGSVDYIRSNDQCLSARESSGKLIKPLREIFQTRLFFYFAYFVFIVIGLGLIFPFILPDTDQTLKAVVSFISILTFKNWEFNLALLLVIANEALVYYRDFKVKKIYSKANPFPMPFVLERADIVLHISIILTGVFVFMQKHPSFAGIFPSIEASAFYMASAVILVTIKLIADVYEVYRNKSQSVKELKMEDEKEAVVKDLNGL